MNCLLKALRLGIPAVILFFSPLALSQPYVCVETNVGEFCMELLEDEAPNTVENFLNYVEDGDYENTMFHRSEPRSLIQGGGFSMDPLGEAIPQDEEIENEFGVSNTRGTVAMAKIANQPDSATSEWFINLTDNSSTLDFSNGGFTVFARIVNGMSIVDSIGLSQRSDLSSSLGEAFTRVPVLEKPEEGIRFEDFIRVISISVVETVEEEPLDPVPEEEEPTDDDLEEERLFQCTADWVTSLAPSTVCLSTNMGEICLDLLSDVAPNTVSNFLHYVADGDYDNTLIHRSVRNFVIQGGGFTTLPLGRGIPLDDPIVNEFNTSNTRGTLAMAKIGGNPDSATSQWFINLGDNSGSLNAENGGYTVFGQVKEEDMAVVDAIAALPIFNLSFISNSLGTTPLIEKENDTGLSTDDFVTVENAYIPGAPANPCLMEVEPTVTELRSNLMTVPVRIGENLYRIVFNMQSIPPEYVFTVDRFRIIRLADVGQEVAVYDGATGQLTIPSIRINNDIVTDVVFSMTDEVSLEFTLQSFSIP